MLRSKRNNYLVVKKNQIFIKTQNKIVESILEILVPDMCTIINYVKRIVLKTGYQCHIMMELIRSSLSEVTAFSYF